MGIQRQKEAAQRAEAMFATGEAHERPADLIADIMHLCLLEGIDFEKEIDTAREYVEQEISSDDADLG